MPIQSIAKTFSGVSAGSWLPVAEGGSLDYTMAESGGTFAGTMLLEYSANGAAPISTAKILTTTGIRSERVTGLRAGYYRLNCTAFTSGNTVGTIIQVTDVTTIIIPAMMGKAGATSGWLPIAGDNVALATLPASKAASTLIIPVPDLQAGRTITAFGLLGQIESAGGAATLDCELRKQTSAAADVVDASVATMTQLAIAIDTSVTAANATKSGLTEVIGPSDSYYLKVTGTTAALTDIALLAATITFSNT